MTRTEVKEYEQYLESTIRMGYFPPEVGQTREYLDEGTFRHVVISLFHVKGLLSRLKANGAVHRYHGYHLGNSFDTFLIT